MTEATCYRCLSMLLWVFSAAYREQVWYHVWVVPQMLFWVLSKRSIPKPDQHRKDKILYSKSH